MNSHSDDSRWGSPSLPKPNAYPRASLVCTRQSAVRVSLPPLSSFLVGAIVWICLLSLGRATAWAQQKQASNQEIILDGYVLTRDKKPIEWATVRIAGSKKGTNTNLKGYYKLSLKPTQDTLIVEYSCIGYQTVKKVFPKGLSRSTHFNPELGEVDWELEGVVVTASSRKEETLEKVKAEHIQVNATPNKGVESLIGTYAGVTQTNELSSQYTVRGGNFDENLVYVNGIEIHRPMLVRTAQQEGLSFVNSDLVQSIYFSAGAFGASYGDRNSSVLDIKYKTPEKNEGAITLGLLYNSAYWGGQIGKLSYITAARYKTARSMLQSSDLQAEYDPRYADIQTYLRWRPSSLLSVGVLGYFSSTDYYFRPHKRETTFGTLTNAKKFVVYFDGAEKDRFMTYTGAVDVLYRPNEKASHTLILSAFGSAERETYDLSGAYFLQEADLGDNSAGSEPDPTRNIASNALATGINYEHARNYLNYRIYTASYKGQYDTERMGSYHFGLETKWEEVQDHISEYTALDSAGYNIPRLPHEIRLKSNLYSDQYLSSFRVASFGEARFKITTPRYNWNITAGSRLAWWSYNHRLMAGGRLAVSMRPNGSPEWLFRWASGIYHQAPFYKEIRSIAQDRYQNNIVVLNPEIRAQSSIQLLLGADYEFSMMERRFRMTLEGYFKYLYHINPYYIDNVKVRYLGQNLGTGYITGIDYKLFGEFVPGVDSWFTASLMQAQQTIGAYGTMPMPNAPRYNLSLFFQDYFPMYRKLSLSLRGALSGGLPQMNTAQGFSRPAFMGRPYKRVDLGVMYLLFDRKDRPHHALSKWLGKVQIGVSCFNLFDMANIDSYYWISDAYNQQYAVPNYLTGRQWDATLSIQF